MSNRMTCDFVWATGFCKRTWNIQRFISLIKLHRKCHTFGTNVHVLIATKRLLLVQHNIAINILTLLYHQSYNIPETAYSFCGVLAPPTTSEISHVQPRGS